MQQHLRNYFLWQLFVRGIFEFFSILQAQTFIWNRFNAAQINRNNRKISWTGIARSLWQHVTACMVLGYNPCGAKFSTAIQIDSGKHPKWVPWQFRGLSGRGVALTTHPYLALMLNKNDSCTSTSNLEFRTLLYKEIYLCFTVNQLYCL